MGKIPNSEIYGNIFEVMQEYHPSSIFRTYEHREIDDGSAEWKSPTEGMSTFEHLVNFDNYLKKLGMKGFTRSEFIIVDNIAYFLEINSIPGMTNESIFPKQAQISGVSITELCDEILYQATV